MNEKRGRWIEIKSIETRIMHITNNDQRSLLYIKSLFHFFNNFLFFLKFKSKKISYKEMYLFTKTEFFHKLVKILKSSTFLQFSTLSSITVIDNLANKKRFKIVYNLISVKYSLRFFIILFVEENKSINSLTNLYNSSNWLEREVWDMFGIFFLNHKDLRRVLTDYGFRGYPLRKDFPLSGYIELRYNDENYSIVYDNIELAQNFRVFNFSNPWEKL